MAQKAAEHLKKSVLELGSNDAYIVLDDADLDVAVDACVTARIYNNGQTCVNGNRFIVTAKNYEDFVARYADKMNTCGFDYQGRGRRRCHAHCQRQPLRSGRRNLQPRQKRARKLAAEQFDTGMISLNGFNLAIPNMPFGGVKNSGYGREHGGFGMKEFVNSKSIYMMDD